MTINENDDSLGGPDEQEGLNERWEVAVDCMPGSRDRFFLMYQDLTHLRLKGPDTGDPDTGEEGYTEQQILERLGEFGYSPQSMLTMLEAARHRAEHAPRPEAPRRRVMNGIWGGWKVLDPAAQDGYAYVMRVPGPHGASWCIGRWDHEWEAYFQCFDSDHGTNVRIEPTHYMPGPDLDVAQLPDAAHYKREGE